MPLQGMMLQGQFRPGQPQMSAALQGLLQQRPPAAGVNPLGMYAGMGGVNMQGLRMDPWKALVIHWDDDTPPNWPNRISPWEVRCLVTPLLAACFFNVSNLKISCSRTTTPLLESNHLHTFLKALHGLSLFVAIDFYIEIKL